MPSDDTLEEPIKGLHATPPAQLPFLAHVEVRAFLLERDHGNVIVYNAPGITSAAQGVRALGGATRLLVNHGHEEMYGRPDLDVPVYVHERDRGQVAGTLPVAGTFTGRRMIDDDLEVIPTPGHTPGSTAYLWDNGAHRFLFTGDSIWVDRGEWSAVVLDPGQRARYVESLALMRDLDFDVLVPWGATKGEPYVEEVTRAQARERIGAIISRVEAGGTR
ncbi:MBL fold metallo-hydrolase [Nocardiopsis sp. RSe5-2]|uniref:MBL fold metallo-hydrolase n=1 Tax=Nocardiopsis endophytica TaxID=3018445 RepID=A0ABT4U5W3_9ACTN|nr:MBL fold metallo-hydrolase [Nocardiopsis endophytica]MDA2812335.1 MBL fold metallo-hydrolase [Nocardiopsis endophytica]